MMISSRNISFLVPYKDRIVDSDLNISRPWVQFLRILHEIVNKLGIESYDEILNNQTTAKDVSGLKLNPDKSGYVIIDFLIQRITTGAGSVELLERGELHCVYKPLSNTWELNAPLAKWPSNSGVTFSITSAGSVQYTSTSISGTAKTSKLTYSARYMACKT